MALGDVDGNGTLDLYVANYRPTTIMDRPSTQFRIKMVEGKPVVALVDGQPATLMSRAVDSTGFVQPAVADLQKTRAIVGFVQHHNAIQPWAVSANGEVRNAIGQA